jgi:hypothetical protein
MAKILADVRRIAATFDMTQNGLGEDLLKAFTDGVKDTIAREESPDGTPWDQLDPKYEAYKAEHYPGQPIAFLEGLMASAEEIEGEPEVTPEEATCTYGKTALARQLAAWFQQGSDENNQPPRPFWGFTESSTAAVKAILAKRLSESVNG